MLKSILIMSVLLSLMIPNMVLCRNRPDTLNSVFLSNDYETGDKKLSAYDDGTFRSDFDDSGGVTGEGSKTKQLLYKIQNDINSNDVEEDLGKNNDEYYYNNDNGNIATKTDGEKKLKLLTLYPALQKRQDTSTNKDLYSITKDDFENEPFFDPVCRCWITNNDRHMMNRRQGYSINAPLTAIARILEESRKRMEKNKIREKLLDIGRK
ncbi:uncharacterized protein LOC106876985 [Octopus bimaculoides]|uniref:Corticotropin-releasing factor domain-containing protein n=1 Tax=Octopus bimaculoides TaxID=37653 RepID=A0A0L8GGD3_OCTBM|nr:uncharacterized protein LOC106876985 [Octopus bimaculoides]|eukprot:XP_014781244.1 PREDICTED: uncharacterized protein LOC106876985 [Octopus bimaculoides]